jgi:hypothetical protein
VPLPVHLHLPKQVPPLKLTVSDMAAERWQEATVLLCIVLIVLMYLLSSRYGSSSTSSKKDEPTSAEKHLLQ